jgi:hypothetical protein
MSVLPARDESLYSLRHPGHHLLLDDLKKPEEYGTRFYMMLHKDMGTVGCNFKQQAFKNITSIFLE